MTRPESELVDSRLSREAESLSKKSPLSTSTPSKEFLRSTPIIDWEQSEIRSLARVLRVTCRRSPPPPAVSIGSGMKFATAPILRTAG